MQRSVPKLKPFLPRFTLDSRLVFFARLFSQQSTPSLAAFEQLAQTYAGVGILKVNGKQNSSCLLIGRNVALTNTHCLPAYPRLELNVCFGSQERGVRDFMIYPPADLFYKFNRQEVNHCASDLAVLFLDGKVHAPRARLDFRHFAISNNLVSVGYPLHFAPTPTDPRNPSLPSPTIFLADKKLAIRQACYRDTDLQYSPYISRPGYQFDYRSQTWVRTTDPLFATTTYNGMSGGGLYRGRKVVGLNCGSWKKENIRFCSFFVPLYSHRFWLQQALKHSRIRAEASISQLAALDALIKAKIDADSNLEYDLSEHTLFIRIQNDSRKSKAQLFMESGLAVAFIEARQGSAGKDWVTTLKLLGETAESAIAKLEKLPDRGPTRAPAKGPGF